jgi:hypothetical protein
MFTIYDSLAPPLPCAASPLHRFAASRLDAKDLYDAGAPAARDFIGEN